MTKRDPSEPLNGPIYRYSCVHAMLVLSIDKNM